jgi:hypothetical protein
LSRNVLTCCLLAGADSGDDSRFGRILDLARADGLGLVWLGPVYLGQRLAYLGKRPVYLGRGLAYLGRGHWLNRRISGNLNRCVSGKLNCRLSGEPCGCQAGQSRGQLRGHLPGHTDVAGGIALVGPPP